MFRNSMRMIVLATAVALGGTALSTAALARGGGFGGGHVGGLATLAAATTLATCSETSMVFAPATSIGNGIVAIRPTTATTLTASNMTSVIETA